MGDPLTAIRDLYLYLYHSFLGMPTGLIGTGGYEKNVIIIYMYVGNDAKKTHTRL